MSAALPEWLPRGTALPEPEWRQRHQLLMAVLVAHVPVLILVAGLNGHSDEHAPLELLLVGALLVSALCGTTRIRRSASVAFGLLVCSSSLVHLSGGLIEMHFHYFVAVALVALYQDWRVYALATGYVVVQHAVIGMLWADKVYNHPAAQTHPGWWALIHTGFVAAASVAQLLFWRSSERSREAEQDTLRQLYIGQDSVAAASAQLAQMRSDLIATVSHEFRTPLTGVRSAALTLHRHHAKLGPQGVEALAASMVVSADRLSRLVENVLVAAEVTRPDASARASLGEVVAQAVAEVQAELAARSDLRPAPIVGALPEVELQIAAPALCHVLGNLLSNAYVHGAGGVPTVRARVDQAADGVQRWVTIDVVSELSGHMSPAEAEALFEPFRQGDGSATRRAEGAGLGLYAARRLISVYGGSLALMPAQGQLTAVVRVPAVNA